MKNNTLILLLFLISFTAKAQENQDERHPIQFYAYTPKLLAINYEFQKLPETKYNDFNKNPYQLNYKYNTYTNLNWFLPLFIKNGLSIINQLEMRFTNSHFSNIDSSNITKSTNNTINSNYLNTFLQVNKSIKINETKSFVLSGQINYYAYKVTEYSRIGGSISGIYYLKNTPEKSLGFGITYDLNSHMTTLVPLIIYYQKMKNNFNLEIFLPWRVGIQKIINSNNYLYVGSRLGTQLDFVKTDKSIFSMNSEMYDIRNTFLKNYILYQHAFNKFLWFEIESGYNHTFLSFYTSAKTLKKNEAEQYLLKSTNFGGFYALIGIALRPVHPKNKQTK